MYMYRYISVCMHVYRRRYRCIWVCICTHAYMHMYNRFMYHTVYVYVCTHVHIYMHTYIHTYIHAYMHACVHAYLQSYLFMSRHDDLNEILSQKQLSGAAPSIDQALRSSNGQSSQHLDLMYSTCGKGPCTDVLLNLRWLQPLLEKNNFSFKHPWPPSY